MGEATFEHQPSWIEDPRFIIPKSAILFNRFNPLNWIGRWIGYGSCGCGKTWWLSGKIYDYAKSPCTGWMVCRHCYRRNKSWLDKHNSEVTGFVIEER